MSKVTRHIAEWPPASQAIYDNNRATRHLPDERVEKIINDCKDGFSGLCRIRFENGKVLSIVTEAYD